MLSTNGKRVALDLLWKIQIVGVSYFPLQPGLSMTPCLGEGAIWVKGRFAP
jgi:hypothetical protein